MYVRACIEYEHVDVALIEIVTFGYRGDLKINRQFLFVREKCVIGEGITVEL